jgi:hypothetical protein
MEIEYIGKFLLLKEEKEKTLVIGDLHLGYEASLRESGILVAEHLFEELEKEINLVLEKIGKVQTVVLLGDVKHSFGGISYYERDQFNKLLKILSTKSKKIIIVKGNHDKLLEYMKPDTKISIKEIYIKNGFAFLHGDKDYDEVWNKEIQTIVLGHIHPAVNLEDGVKKEKYKCFLQGEYKKKRIIIVPSATGKNEGTDPRDYEANLPWDLELEEFEVIIAGENLENYMFGRLKEI